MKLICGLLAILIISTAAQAQPPAGQNTRLSPPMTLQEARARVRQLELEIEQKLASIPPLSPKDMFESTADYNKRKDAYESKNQFESIRSEIDKMKAGFYVDTNSKVLPVFETYDADTKVLRLTLDGKVLSFIVPNAEAKLMHDKWSSVTLGWEWSESGKNGAPLVLIWNGRTYEGTANMYLGPDVYTVGGAEGVSAPVCETTEPTYTEEARKAAINGAVLLEAVVRKDGIIEVSRVLQSLGYGLDEEAMKALSKWRCTPGKLKREPVAVQLQIKLNFHLSGDTVRQR